MAREELGTKRICKSCGTKFYDLSKEPIVCPSCKSIFELITETVKSDAMSEQKTDNAPEAVAVELVSLDKADGEEDIDVETSDIEIDGDDDDTFLAVDDDDDSVSDLIVNTQDDKEE